MGPPENNAIVRRTLLDYTPERIEELEQAMLDCPEQV